MDAIESEHLEDDQAVRSCPSQSEGILGMEQSARGQAHSPLTPAPAWRTSSLSNGDAANTSCVQIALGTFEALVRDSKDAHGHYLTFSPIAWSGLLCHLQVTNAGAPVGDFGSASYAVDP